VCGTMTMVTPAGIGIKVFVADHDDIISSNSLLNIIRLFVSSYSDIIAA